MLSLARAREAARARAGGIDFATTEAKVVLDAEGRPTDIALRRKTMPRAWWRRP